MNQPPLPPGAVPGTSPYAPGLPGPPPGHAPPPSGGSGASMGMALGALLLSLTGCLVFPIVYVVVGVWVSHSEWDTAMMVTAAIGALVVLTSIGLSIAALVQARRGQAGRQTMAVFSLILACLSPFTGAAGIFFSLLLAAGGGPHGRPLRRRDGVPTSAALATDGAWGDAPADLPRVEGLAAADRRARGARWLAIARAEHASVPAFARLSLDLIALGAPPALVAGAHRAALEEIEHARAAFAIAGAYLGQPVSAGDLPEAAAPWADAGEPAEERAVRVAIESQIEGCEGEGGAARAAALEAAIEGDPAVRAVLHRIAREEATHAALASDVVAWLGAGPHRASVRRALEARAPRAAAA